MKISFLNPTFTIDPIIAKEQMDIGENIGIGLLTSYLRNKGFEVQILYGSAEQDAINETIEKLKSFNPDVVGITVMSQTYPLFRKYSMQIKKEVDIPIVVGGILPSILQEHFLNEFDSNNEIDYLICGDGEDTILELLMCLDEKNKKSLYDIRGLVWRKDNLVIKNKPRNTITDLDKYPFSARDYAPQILNTYNNNATIPAMRIITSRGCYRDCLFCHICEYYKSMDKKVWRYRSPKNILREIIFLKNKFNVNHFLISDDNFLGCGDKGIERAKEFASLVVNNNIDITFCIQTRIDQIDLDTIYILKKAGLIGIDVGIETIDIGSLKFFHKKLSLEHILDNIKKISKLNGIYLGIYMLNIHPLSTIEETYNNYRFLDALGYFDVENENKEIYRKLISTKLEITKYTRMYYELQKNNLLGSPIKGNEVMYDFKFKDSKMEIFYLKVLHYVKNNGLHNFKKFLLSEMSQQII